MYMGAKPAKLALILQILYIRQSPLRGDRWRQIQIVNQA
jgi:hypothetical protein